MKKGAKKRTPAAKPAMMWCEVVGYGERAADEKSWWLGALDKDGKPVGVGYFVFLREVVIEEGKDGMFGAYVLRRSDCRRSGKRDKRNESNWDENIAIFGGKGKAMGFAQIHRASPAGWEKPPGIRWHQIKEQEIGAEVWWYGEVGKRGKPAGRGFCVLRPTGSNVYGVYWMRHKGDVSPTIREPLYQATELQMAHEWAEKCREVITPEHRVMEEWA